MKKLLYVMASLVLLFGSCTRELETRLTDVEARLTKLEDQIKELNSQVSLIQKLINGKYFVQSATELPDGSGYKLVLVDKDGNTLEKTVLNGKDGSDGKDGVSPSVSVKKDTDGNYYWTLNGEWLLVGGEKVRANGIDGANGKDAPETQFKVENGKWYMKVGDGAWTYVGEAATVIQGPIASIDASRADVVLITLTDNTVLELPKASFAVKLQILVDDSVFQNMTAGQSQSASYEVKVPAGVTYTLDSYEPENWKVTLSEPKNNKGIVTISVPSTGKSGKVLLIANGSDGSSYAKVLHIKVEGGEEEAPVAVQEIVDASAGSVTLPVGAKEVVLSSTWITLSGNKLIIAANDTYDSRMATIEFKVGEKSYILTVLQAQKDAIVLTENALQVVAEGEEIPFVIKANVTVEAAADVAWIAVSPATKGLEEKPFTLTVAKNESAESRKGTITFSSGELQQVVTVTQEGAESVMQYDALGLYLGERVRVYQAGTDQYVRSYDGSALQFVLLEPKGKEQVKLSGLSTSLQPGDAVTVSVDWRKDKSQVLEKDYPMTVLKVQDGKLWIGDAEGRGVIVRK